ncbi:MAG TPA: diacylglycerol kinase family protein [Gemmatimonadaceae bacterium]|nr:diacylglycerol kinase family protein [Gemmatimonadaceae bacterium]
MRGDVASTADHSGPVAVSGESRLAVTVPIPALLNPEAGGAAKARAALVSDARFAMHELAPAAIIGAVREEIRRGTPRILVSGGDGTLCTVIGAAAGTALEIAIFPGGTLNHFARDFGLPIDDPATLLDIAAGGTPRPVNLGYVNGHPILNTSSVGVYVDFVRRREHLEHRMSYRPASVAAAIDVWRDPHALDVELITADGAHRRLRTPLVFVGVQERILDRGGLGRRRAAGACALHILVVNAHERERIHALALEAAARGIAPLIAEKEIDCYLTSSAVVTTSRATDTIAIDGELIASASPLRYEIVPSAATVVHQ